MTAVSISISGGAVKPIDTLSVSNRDLYRNRSIAIASRSLV